MNASGARKRFGLRQSVLTAARDSFDEFRLTRIDRHNFFNAGAGTLLEVADRGWTWTFSKNMESDITRAASR